MARSEKSRMPKPSKRLDRRKTTSTRIKPEVRSQLEEAASQSHRSLAQEIELRLEQSFVEYDARLRGFGSEERLPLLRALGLAVEMVEMTTGKNISTDAETAKAAYEAMHRIIDGLFGARPGGPLDTVTPTEGQEMILKNPTSRSFGQNVGDTVLECTLPQWPTAAPSIAKKGKSGRR